MHVYVTLCMSTHHGSAHSRWHWFGPTHHYCIIHTYATGNSVSFVSGYSERMCSTYLRIKLSSDKQTSTQMKKGDRMCILDEFAAPHLEVRLCSELVLTRPLPWLLPIVMLHNYVRLKNGNYSNYT